MQVPGSAQFDTGEDVVLTIGSKNSDDSYDLRGLSTGKFNLEKDADGKEYLKATGVSEMTPPDARPYQHLLNSDNGENTRHRVSLEELRHIVQTQAEESSASPEALKAPHLRHLAELPPRPRTRQFRVVFRRPLICKTLVKERRRETSPPIGSAIRY